MTYFTIRVKDITGDKKNFISYESPDVDDDIGELTIIAENGAIVKYNLANVIYYEVFEAQEEKTDKKVYEYDNI